jgi:hypothetical protein
LDIKPEYTLNPPTTRDDELVEWIKKNEITDLWIVSHGWRTSSVQKFDKRTPDHTLCPSLPSKTRLDGKKSDQVEGNFGIGGITLESTKTETTPSVKTTASQPIKTTTTTASQP